MEIWIISIQSGEEQITRWARFSGLRAHPVVQWSLLETYPPLSVGVRPKRVQSPTDMSSELSTVTTAARASPHLDLTMSILPGRQRRNIRAAPPTTSDPCHGPLTELWGIKCILTINEEKAPWFNKERDNHRNFPIS